MRAIPLRLGMTALCGLLIAAGVAWAFEVGATIRGLDVGKRVLTVFANGAEHTVAVAGDAHILDRAGKELPGGLTSPALKAGTRVTLTLQRATRAPRSTPSPMPTSPPSPSNG